MIDKPNFGERNARKIRKKEKEKKKKQQQQRSRQLGIVTGPHVHDTGHPTLEIALGRRDADRKMHRAEGGMLRARKTLVEGCQCWRENGGGTRRRRKRSRERDVADGNSRVTRTRTRTRSVRANGKTNRAACYQKRDTIAFGQGRKGARAAEHRRERSCQRGREL